MIRTRVVTLILSVNVVMVIAGFACAQDYPTRPIRIVTSGVGAGNDFVSRLIAQGIAGILGQQVIVDNRASSAMPQLTVARSSPDGYSVLVNGPTVWLSQFMRDDMPYDVVKDFAPVAIVDKSALLLVVHPSLPIYSVKDLIAYAKAKPGVLNYSTGATGSTSHLAPELFKSMTGVNMVRVPYKTGPQQMIDLIAGQVQLTFSPGAAAPHAKSGKLRALAHTSEQPSALYPGVPTIAEIVPGYRAGSFTAMFVPARTPAAVIKRLNEVTVRFLRTPEAKEALLSNGGAEPGGSSPEELATAIRADVVRWGKIIRDAGIKSD